MRVPELVVLKKECSPGFTTMPTCPRQTTKSPGCACREFRPYPNQHLCGTLIADLATESERNIRWTRERWEIMKPFLVESSYGNYLSDEGDPVAGAAYGANYDRLAAFKRRYDPTNVFPMNHNIKPAVRPAVA